jgi:hypothetical protein
MKVLLIIHVIFLSMHTHQLLQNIFYLATDFYEKDFHQQDLYFINLLSQLLSIQFKLKTITL